MTRTHNAAVERHWWKIVGAIIKYWRLERDLTQAQLADKLSVSHVSVSQAENGYRRILAYDLARYAEALKVDVRKLMPATDVALNALKRIKSTKAAIVAKVYGAKTN